MLPHPRLNSPKAAGWLVRIGIYKYPRCYIRWCYIGKESHVVAPVESIVASAQSSTSPEPNMRDMSSSSQGAEEPLRMNHGRHRVRDEGERESCVFALVDRWGLVCFCRRIPGHGGRRNVKHGQVLPRFVSSEGDPWPWMVYIL